MWSDYGIIRRGRAPDYQSAPIIMLSNTTAFDTAGSLVGVLSAIGTGTYRFTLTSNPGSLFSISGSNLNVTIDIPDGSYQVSIRADNGLGSNGIERFVITVIKGFRITDTGNVRVTNTGDSRTVS